MKEIVDIKSIPLGAECNLEEPIEFYKLALEMEAICTNSGGIGLSAVQLGVPYNFFVVNFDGYYKYYANCDYTSNGNKIKSIEGCLSIKDKNFEVDRYELVNVRGKELVGEPKIHFVDINFPIDGMYSIVFQHEIDHSKGILISDIGREVLVY